MSFLSRYLAGEHRQVWSDLEALGDGVRHEPALSDARAVAEETMRRVRRNLERMEARLHALGYDFARYPDGMRRAGGTAPLSSPSPHTAREVAALREAAGPIPLSLDAFWSTVGGVDLVGRHPSWPRRSDPLVVSVPGDVMAELDDWRDWVADDPEEAGPFVVPLAPDVLHKDNVSGGQTYGIELPAATADAPLRNAPRTEPLVDYLRRAILEWGGFPGLEHVDVVPAELRVLTEGLEPF